MLNKCFFGRTIKEKSYIAVPRPDPAADPRWEAALRAVGTRTPITRVKPEVNRDVTDVTLTVNNGMTKSSNRQGMSMVSRSSVRTAEAITAEPHWDSHVVESVPELDDAIRGRTKLMHQASWLANDC